MKKAFRGPNGWYVAEEDSTGTHYQADDGERYETKAAALAADDPPYGCWVDTDGTIYNEATGGVVGRAE